MNDAPTLNRFFAVTGTLTLLGAASILGFLVSETLSAGAPHSSMDLVVQAVGIFILLFFFFVAAMTSTSRALNAADPAEGTDRSANR